jgi:hypothetical protein
MFILYSMRSIEVDIENMGVGSTFKAINKDAFTTYRFRLLL